MPILKSPSNGEALSTFNLRLEWNPIQSALFYSLKVSANKDFTSLVINQTGVTETFYDIPAGIIVLNNNYYWRVNAVLPNGVTNWSDYWSFKHQPFIATPAVSSTPTPSVFPTPTLKPTPVIQGSKVKLLEPVMGYSTEGKEVEEIRFRIMLDNPNEKPLNVTEYPENKVVIRISTKDQDQNNMPFWIKFINDNDVNTLLNDFEKVEFSFLPGDWLNEFGPDVPFTIYLKMRDGTPLLEFSRKTPPKIAPEMELK